MKTIEVMSTAPRTVRVVDRLDAAARTLWEADCGVVPVVDASGELVGIVTDRDLCMASYTQGRSLTEIPVAAVMSQQLATCRPDEPLSDVMQTMQRLRVHRLPVVDAHGKLVGMISTNDLVRAAHARPAAVDPVAVVRTLAAIGAPRQARAASPAPAAAAAKAERTPAGAAEADQASSRATAPVRKKAAAAPRESSARQPASKPARGSKKPKK